IVHWPSFKEAYDDGTVPNYLILAIRALSKRYSKQPSVVLSGQLYAAGQDLAAIATSLAEAATREDPNTYLIQTWIILSMFEFGMGRMKQAADRRELAVSRKVRRSEKRPNVLELPPPSTPPPTPCPAAEVRCSGLTGANCGLLQYVLN
ncbi:hypothetical protein GQ54DRAFT_296392, partial [Martensiomyces pterosporus]